MKQTEQYQAVRDTIMRHHEWSAWKVAAHLGLSESMGTEDAAQYVREVRKTMRDNGDLIIPQQKPKYADPEARLRDVLTLFELREYKVNKKVAKNMLLAMCYWIFVTKGNWPAVSDTMDMNDRLERPLAFQEIEAICNAAQDKGFMVLDDEEANRTAVEAGYPDAGYNWTSDNLYHLFQVTDDELPHLKTIGKPISRSGPQGIPNPERMPK